MEKQTKEAIDRMVIEIKDLEEKREKLSKFIFGEKFATLPKMAQILLKMQAWQQSGLVRLLNARKDKMEDETKCKVLSNVVFSDALSAVMHGAIIKRQSWGPGSILYFVPAAVYPAMTNIAKAIADENGNVPYNAYFALTTPTGVQCWEPTTDDILACDWMIATEEMLQKPERESSPESPTE